MAKCECDEAHETRRVVLTGGPGAGKTATLELIKQSLCEHVRVLPEAAGIVFGGGFPRSLTVTARKAAQRAIFYVQRELERSAEEDNAAIILCDRGTIDGLAYWPGPEELWTAVGTTYGEQLARYDTVIHLRTPPLSGGYNHDNPLRTESAIEAAGIDARILDAWNSHPRRFLVQNDPDFVEKAAQVITLIRNELPTCCKSHVGAEFSATGRKNSRLGGPTTT